MENSVRLLGHSGCEVFLKKYSDGTPYVLKTGEISRNIERMSFLLEQNYPVPKIYNYTDCSMEMEYIHGLDIKTHLIYNSTKNLYKFIVNTLEKFSVGFSDKDYTEVYNKKLQWLDNTHEFPFTKSELIDRLPKILPQSVYHGDMTLENLMSTKDGFYMIDPVTIEYDSYIFDIAKMRQDLECRWFLRNADVKIGVKLKLLQDKILDRFPLAKNDNLLILMLLRVYLHTTKNDTNYNFIMKEVKRLWK
mgnify:FL=1